MAVKLNPITADQIDKDSTYAISYGPAAASQLDKDHADAIREAGKLIAESIDNSGISTIAHSIDDFTKAVTELKHIIAKGTMTNIGAHDDINLVDVFHRIADILEDRKS